jgi:hypothetical protein
VEQHPFDIIKILSDDRLQWLETAEELKAARLRVWELLADSPGEYIVFNQETKTLVAHFSIQEAPQIPEWWRRDDDYAHIPHPAVPAIEDNSTLDDDNFEEYEDILQRSSIAVL